jgi:hypothetical protein
MTRSRGVGDETADLGTDTGRPSGRSTPQSIAFTGKIERVQIDVDEAARRTPIT